MIGFAAPWALLGLLAAALPVLLHLVQRREPPEVAFPAVRYLEDATRDHRRRLKLRHLLLLVVRTLLIIALVIAAARPTLARGGVGDHVPSALVLVVDNSASSAAMIDGVSTLEHLVGAARAVLGRATAADRLWLLTADGVARPGTPSTLTDRLATVTTQPVRFDLGAAVSQGRDLIRGAGRPGEVVVVTDLQRTALTGARDEGVVLVLRPSAAAPLNRGVSELATGSQPWGPGGGRVGISVTGSDTAPVPVTVAVGERNIREVLVSAGAPAAQRIPPAGDGWTTLTATVPPDEFRLDDERTVALHVAPPAPVRWDAHDRWLAAALDVLAADGRVRSGDGLRLGSIGPGPSVVLPPNDPALIGALNRVLAARGSAWRFGAPVVTPGRTDSSTILPARESVTRRVAIERSGSAGEVLATVGGEPWLVRSGDLLLLGSRMEPEWTALPLSAEFVPFLDAVVTRAARGVPVVPDIAAGDAVRLPDRTTAIAHGGSSVRTEGGALWRPQSLGVHYLLAGADTLGAVSVHVDSRESALARAADGDVRTLWGDARVEDLERGPRFAFTAAGRGDLRGPLLIVACLLALAEIALAGRVTARS